MAGTSWKKSPPELVAAFEALAARRPELTVRAIAHVRTLPPKG